jgi:hypothetical protein
MIRKPAAYSENAHVRFAYAALLLGVTLMAFTPTLARSVRLAVLIPRLLPFLLTAAWWSVTPNSLATAPLMPSAGLNRVGWWI